MDEARKNERMDGERKEARAARTPINVNWASRPAGCSLWASGKAERFKFKRKPKALAGEQTDAQTKRRSGWRRGQLDAIQSAPSGERPAERNERPTARGTGIGRRATRQAAARARNGADNDHSNNNNGDGSRPSLEWWCKNHLRS